MNLKTNVKAQRSLAMRLTQEIVALTGYDLLPIDVLHSLAVAGISLDVADGDVMTLAYLEELG